MPDDNGVAVGDVLVVALPTGELELRVTGEYAQSQLLFGKLVVGLDTLERGDRALGQRRLCRQ